ncbi:MAG: hypothetical protein HON70_11550 [Lentisphaerae bacterium]|nr:hypothetical protein [Lentisphaerota bacterium]
MLTTKSLRLVLVVEFLLLAGVSLGLLALRGALKGKGETPGTTQEWETVRERTRLTSAFAATIDLEAPPKGEASFRIRLLGQTRTIDVVANKDELAIWHTTARRKHTRLSVAPWPPETTGPFTLRLLKNADSVGVALNQTRVLWTPCPTEDWRKLQWQKTTASPDLPPASHQKIGTLLFADDFMHDEGELGEWQAATGTWTIHALQNPIRSANPFSLVGTGDQAAVLTGYWFWQNYELSCAIQPQTNSQFGVLFCATDHNSTYRLRSTPEADTKPAGISLERITDGTSELLSFVEFPARPERWLRLKVTLQDGLITACIDDRVILQFTDDSPLFGGRVGLWTDGPKGCVFDDVDVRPTGHFYWESSPDPDPLPAVLLTSKSGPTPEGNSPLGKKMTVAGIVRENLSIMVDVAGLPTAGEAIELRLRENAAGEHLGFRLARTATGWHGMLFSKWHERELSIDQADINADLKSPISLSLHALGDTAKATLGGNVVCFGGGLPTVSPGRAGVVLPSRMNAGDLTRLVLAPETELPLIENRVETFTHEESMQSWSSPALEWYAEYGSRGFVYWHRSDFWKDVSISLDTTAFRSAKLGNKWGLAMRGEATHGDPADVTVTMLQTGETHTLELSLMADVTKTMPVSRIPKRIGLTKQGTRLLVYLDDALAWNVPIPPQLDALCRVGRFGRGASETWADAIDIGAAGVQTYAFKRAPTDWLPSAGAWKVTNRWQCDPRWSFFSGAQRNGPACNWNKRLHGENVTVEFFAGPKMDQDRGRKYEYAADINAVICADGININTGYSFMFGGWNDTGTYVTRQNTVLAKNSECVVPRKSSTHRQWFHVKLRKHGDRLTFWIDGKQVIATQDPSPLTGRRFALWTWDNGIMVAQLRVASDGDLPPAPAAPQPENAPETPYTTSRRPN